MERQAIETFWLQQSVITASFPVEVSSLVSTLSGVDGKVTETQLQQARDLRHCGPVVAAFGKKGIRCQQNELDRIAMTLRQPQSMQNYTAVGYKKIKAPEKVWKMIKEFWDANHQKAKAENWGMGNTYTNNNYQPIPSEPISSCSRA